MEPTAILVFLLIWLFTAVTAGMGRSRRAPRGDWPRLPGRLQPAVEPPARVEEPPEASVARPVRGHRVAAESQPEPQLEAGDRCEAFLDFFEPGRMVSAVVLSEILGPPRGRRPGAGFFRYPRRNRLYSGGERRGGAERGTDPE